MIYQLRTTLERLLKPHGKLSFIQALPLNAKLLDVGCGNNSPMNTRMQRPDLLYVGLDIGDYNQARPVTEFASKYIVTTGDNFAVEIDHMRDEFDAVISSHNLEHCNYKMVTLSAMLNAVKTGGMVYLSFPSAASVHFPHRRGTLNYYDDDTHKAEPPAFAEIVAAIHSRGFQIEFAKQRYRPVLLAFIGLMLEPIGLVLGRNMPVTSTWALYGFETIIWARRTRA